MPDFEVVSPYEPSGDQPEAIDTLVQGLENGIDEQVLLGVTGSGKTYTMAKVIERVLEKTAVASQQLQRARRPIPAATSCKGCGASVPAGSRYCPQCGVRLDA